MEPHQVRPGPVRSRLLAALVVVVALTIAGCGGSAISAEKAVRANAALQGGPVNQVGAEVPGSTPLPGGVAPTPGGSGIAPTPGSPDNPGTVPDGGNHGGGIGVPGPPAPPKGASCAGFKNGPGITDKVTRLGNSSDISGPVPGLFTAAQQATQAYISYFNGSGATICGRRLELDLYDSRTDSAGDQTGYQKGCETDFAMVGSMSAFDSGGAKTAETCGLPDVRGIATTTARGDCRTCFGAQPAGPQAFQNAVPDFIIRRTGGKKAAMLYINIGASAANGESQAKHQAARGMHYSVKSGVDIAAFNYSPYVQKMKDAGVDSVQFIAASPQFARLAQAFAANSYKPKVFLLDPSAYNDDYPKLAGDAAKGTYVFLNFVPFEEASTSSEMQLYMRYLQQVAPGAKPTFFGVFAWSATRLFVEQATKLGGKLNRASLIAAMRKVDNWTSNGIHAPQHVGSKKIGDCWRFIQWTGTAWVPVEGRKYQCRGLTTG
jgi:ABC-type branched-subunit amino acid transport system substrate-binding protein